MNQKLKQLNKKRKGFSLVELVVVMAIIGILLVVMAPNYKGFIDDAKRVGVKADARTLDTMITLAEINKTIDRDKTVGSLSELTGGTEITTLTTFIAELEGGSIALKEAKISQLQEIIKTGTIPTP